jgi:hypothetical protein
MSTRRRRVSSLMAALTLIAGAAGATEWPRPPCGGSPVPAYPTAPGSPNIQSQPVRGWTPPTCLGWNGTAPTEIVAIAGRLHESSGADALLARFGAISQMIGVRYWSTTEQAWRNLFHEAFAVTDVTGAHRRDDFRPEELQPGASLHLAERDGRSSGVVIYRMRVIARTPDRVVVNVVNASPVGVSVVTLFKPGELQTTYFLERLGPDDWGYFGLWGLTTGVLTGGHLASAINRAVALYRQFVGIPSDQEPPPARQ